MNTINGCDSIVNLNLTVHPIYSENITEVICEGESVTVGTSTYTSTGNYTDILASVNGCDSIVNLDLTVNPIYTEDITEVICEGESENVATITGNECGIRTLECTDTATVIAEGQIEELVADAKGPYSGYTSENVYISGSATGGVSPYTYEWDLDDDGEYDDETGKKSND